MSRDILDRGLLELACRDRGACISIIETNSLIENVDHFRTLRCLLFKVLRVHHFLPLFVVL